MNVSFPILFNLSAFYLINSPVTMEESKRERLDDKKRYLIKFLSEENNLSPEEIRKHPKVLRKDGSMLQLKVRLLESSKKIN